MRKLLTIIPMLLLLLTYGCSGKEDIIDKESPIIISQTVVNGDVDVTAAPQTIYILFDREIREGATDAIVLEPTAPMEVSVKENYLLIALPEGLEYHTAYTLTLGSGAVRDRVTGGDSAERIINFTTEEKPHTPSIRPTYSLVTEEPLEAAKNIYDYLWRLNGRWTLSGASVGNKWDVNDCYWVYDKTGKYPAIASFDYCFLHVSPSQSMNYTDTAMVEEWWNQGGLVAATWLWMVPKQKGAKNYTLESADTEFAIGNMLSEGCWENQVMKSDLQEMADILLLLQQKGVAVLWRPLPHSTNGAKEPYYWWERDGGKVYKQLWRAMFDYFESRGVRNLIWVWTLVNDDVDYYPGVEYVDIVGGDLYNRFSVSSCLGCWDTMRYWFPDKILIVGELQKAAPIGEQLDAGAKWGAFIAAYDPTRGEGDSHQAASAEWWSATLGDERVLSREDLPNFAQ